MSNERWRPAYFSRAIAANVWKVTTVLLSLLFPRWPIVYERLCELVIVLSRSSTRIMRTLKHTKLISQRKI